MLKKIIYFLGVILLAIVIILNIFVTAELSSKEIITIKFNSILRIAIILISIFLIFFVSKKLMNFCESKFSQNKKLLKIMMFAILLIYLIINILWVILIRPNIVGDPCQIYDLSKALLGNEDVLSNITYAKTVTLGNYAEIYNQQILLSLIFAFFFKIFRTDNYFLIRGLNVICNLITFITILKIAKLLSSEYKINKILLCFETFTFFSLIMFTTFIYGDVMAISMCLVMVYFAVKYCKSKKIKDFILMLIFGIISYMIRMNSLIFIIATAIYLILDVFQEKNQYSIKQIFIHLLIIAIFVVGILGVTTLIKNLCLKSLNLSTDKNFSTISYILMGMEDSSKRGYGWYDEDIAEKVLVASDTSEISVEYKARIKERLVYFVQNPGYTIKFYITKIASMWTENTYSAIRNNMQGVAEFLENWILPITICQKILLIVSCVGALKLLICERKNLSLEVLFLITIFIGGFLFHVIWEAKSRYILPYVVILIILGTIERKEV